MARLMLLAPLVAVEDGLGELNHLGVVVVEAGDVEAGDAMGNMKASPKPAERAPLAPAAEEAPPQNAFQSELMAALKKKRRLE